MEADERADAVHDGQVTDEALSFALHCVVTCSELALIVELVGLVWCFLQVNVGIVVQLSHELQLCLLLPENSAMRRRNDIMRFLFALAHYMQIVADAAESEQIEGPRLLLEE